MPVPLFKHSFHRREAGVPKSHAHAAYISGTKLDDGKGHVADFTPKGGVLFAEIWVPEGAPDWAKNRGEFWRRVEAREDKTTRPANAIIAHRFIGALPCELTVEENIRYIKDFVREQFTRKGYVADWAIHAPDPGSDGRNYHVHILVPLRKLEGGAFAKIKDRFPKNTPALSQFIRAHQFAFFKLQNRYLEKNGVDARLWLVKGKWSVVDKSALLTGRQTEVITAAMHQRQPGKVLAPIVRPSRPTSAPSAQPVPAPGGGNTSSSPTLRETLLRAARAEAASGKAAGAVGFRRNVSTNGWPPAAIKDWNEWGWEKQIKFFALWPQLATSTGPRGGL